MCKKCLFQCYPLSHQFLIVSQHPWGSIGLNYLHFTERNLLKGSIVLMFWILACDIFNLVSMYDASHINPNTYYSMLSDACCPSFKIWTFCQQQEHNMESHQMNVERNGKGNDRSLNKIILRYITWSNIYANFRSDKIKNLFDQTECLSSVCAFPNMLNFLSQHKWMKIPVKNVSQPHLHNLFLCRTTKNDGLCISI